MLCTYQQPSRGLDPGDIQANSVGFADFCCHFLVWDRGIGPLLHFRGKIYSLGKTCRSCNIAAILKLKDRNLVILANYIPRVRDSGSFLCKNIGPGSRGVLGISSDGDDQRIFLGLKFSILGFFGYKNLASIFCG